MINFTDKVRKDLRETEFFRWDLRQCRLSLSRNTGARAWNHESVIPPSTKSSCEKLTRYDM